MASLYLTRLPNNADSVFRRIRLVDRTIDQAEQHAARILALFIDAMVNAHRLATSTSHSMAVNAIMQVRDIATAVSLDNIASIPSPTVRAARYDESRWHYAYVMLTDAVARAVTDFAGDWCEDSCPICYALSECMATVSATSEVMLDMTSMHIDVARSADVPAHLHEVFPIINRNGSSPYWAPTCVICAALSMHRLDDMYGAITASLVHASEVKRHATAGVSLDN